MKKEKKLSKWEQRRSAKKNFIPFRFIFNILLIIIETLLVCAAVIFLTAYVDVFYFVVFIIQLTVAIRIIGSEDSPEYKVPWLFFVMLLPVIGFMLYFMFYSRRLSKTQMRKIDRFISETVPKDDILELSMLESASTSAHSQANLLRNLAGVHVYGDTEITYFDNGQKYFYSLLRELNKAEKFIFMEYFLIEKGSFWNSVLEVLTKKASSGVEVRVVYDDIGCMKTLPGDYYAKLNKLGIKCVPFFKIKGQANNEFNNRSHRKITVIDGKVGFTGGVNVADEYINRTIRFGHWKDVGIMLTGNAVNELTRLFLLDYNLNDKKCDDEFFDYYVKSPSYSDGWCVPFGDGPRPVYDRYIAETAIINLLGQAKNYVYMTTPYLIIDNTLVQAIENAALRGVDVRIITPHIPDKKMVFNITRSYYNRLIKSGVKIFEYEPGFIHAKNYLADGDTAIVGTINLDYRSLVHHFENGVWMYKTRTVADIERDFLETQKKSIPVDETLIKQDLSQRFKTALFKVFSPLL